MKADWRGRIPTRLPGTMWVGRRRQSVTVRNVSTGGAMIEGASAIEESAHIRLECSVIGSIEAMVVWVVGNRCGLLFDRPVTLDLGDLDEDAA